MVLALGAHALLFVALAWGIAWKHDATPASFEVEVWSPEAVRAAPKAEPPPEPEPEPKPEPEPPKPEPEPEPPAPEPPPPPPPPPPKAAPAGPSEAEIALEKAKKKKAAEEALALKKAKEKAAKEKAEREQAAKEKAAKEKAAKEKARKEQLAKEEAAKAKAAKEKAEREQAEREKAAEEARQRAAAEQALKERFRREQIARLSNLAGKVEDTGTAQKASGPSATYAGKVVAAVRPNIIFPGTVAGNPSAEVEVTTLPTGEILGRKLIRSSGDPDWDTAVLRAIDRTQRLPRDVDGRVPSPMIIAFRPKD
jgi:colicin import membrane protein